MHALHASQQLPAHALVPKPAIANGLRDGNSPFRVVRGFAIRHWRFKLPRIGE